MSVQMRSRVAVALAGLVLVVACSGPTSPSPATPSTPRLSRTRFLAFGDSTTAGEVTAPVGHAGPPWAPLVVLPDVSYPTVLGGLLSSRYATQTQTLSVVNAGRSGEPIVDALPRFIESFERERPDVVLLLDGYNDLLGRGLAAVDSSATAMTALASEAKTRGARVFVATMTPNRPDRQRSIATAAILAYNDRLRALVVSERAVLVDLYAALLPTVDTAIGVDGLHPTEIGYRRIADSFFTAIVSDLEAR